VQCERLTRGTSKLLEASDQLDVLNEKLALQRVAVVEKTAACEKLLNDIADATQRTEDKKTLAEEKGKEAEDQSKAIEMEKVRCSFNFWGTLSHRPPIGALPLDSAGGLDPQSSFMSPQ